MKKARISEMKIGKEMFEKARILKEYIENIRVACTKDFTSEDAEKRQLAVATYLVDRLCLRAGYDPDDDKSETVEVCKLNIQNVKTIPPNSLELNKETTSGNVSKKLSFYQQAQRKVSAICNFYHTTFRRGVLQLYRLKENMRELQGTMTELQTELNRTMLMGLPPLRNANENLNGIFSREDLERTAETSQLIEKVDQDIRTVKNRKETFVVTPRTKYFDTRIIAAWCKRNEVPPNKICNKYDCKWAMDVDGDYRFGYWAP